MSNLDETLDRQQYAQVFEFFNETTESGKVVYHLPARKPITLDVVIVGDATVKVYRSNLTSDPEKTAFWGEPMATYTDSAKMVIEDEPWLYWMVEVSGITGTVSVATGA